MMNYKIGIGYDIHKFSKEYYDEDNEIKICGISIPYHKKLLAHSDGDVGLHALVDAILGAIAMGDIGSHFPSSDDKWKDVDSIIFLKEVMVLLAKKEYKIGNIDINIICESPKLSPYKDKMRALIAEITGVDISSVSIKGKTNDKMGYIGEKKAIVAQAIVLCYSTKV